MQKHFSETGVSPIKMSSPIEFVDLSNAKAKIVQGEEVRIFTFLNIAGPGRRDSFTWKAKDHYGTPFALKLVPKSHYKSHSIEGELQRTHDLGPRFAKILCYGELRLEDNALSEWASQFYAIVVEWFVGVTFEDFCNAQPQLDHAQFLQLALDLCEALATLAEKQLCHNDLKEKNILITKERKGPRLTEELVLKVIDSGSLKSVDRRDSLIEEWKNEVQILARLQGAVSEQTRKRLDELNGWIGWFSREDQEWIVSHICRLVNLGRQSCHQLPAIERQFFSDLTPILQRMVDLDRNMRTDQPASMYDELELLWKRISAPSQSSLQTPFDFISAELIRNDRTLNDLFSQECPWYQHCATTDPIYIYGPRGCGKSTILRMLSLPAVLQGPKPRDVFMSRPYIGIYISCSSELRSRFWLFPKEEYPGIEVLAIKYFIMLLAEAMLETFEMLRDGNVEKHLGVGVGLTNDTARSICEIVCESFDLPKASGKLQGVSWLNYAKTQLFMVRQGIWKEILRSPSGNREGVANPALLFDLCKRLEECWPLLREKHIAFLVDDYSNQRIPVELQRLLNQTISFSKQGNPIFKVSSEYLGLDLEGIQEGREVVEVNVGLEYVNLTDNNRSAFLEDVLDIRFKLCNLNYKASDLLGKSHLGPVGPMARAIRESSSGVGAGQFYYHGIDTIADVCSGDLATALDLVKQIYWNVTHPVKGKIPEKVQNDCIKKYADREHSYIRYHAPFGKEISEVMENLCWLAHQCAVKNESEKDGRKDPMVKTHMDIKNLVFEQMPDELNRMFEQMVKRGYLFSLDTSRSRLGKEGTLRFQIRRILLAKYPSPLGRRDPIKIDHSQQLIFLLNEPREFAIGELGQAQQPSLYRQY